VLTRKKRQIIHLEGSPLVGRVSLVVGRIGVSLREEEDEADIHIEAVRANSVERWELIDPPAESSGTPPVPEVSERTEGPPGNGGQIVQCAFAPAVPAVVTDQRCVIVPDAGQSHHTVSGMPKPSGGATCPGV
jgi:hypothetical protein